MRPVDEYAALGASADTEPVASVNEPTLISEEQQEQNYASAAADFSMKLFQLYVYLLKIA